MKRTVLKRRTRLVAKLTLTRKPFTQSRVKHRRPREVSNSRPAHGARGEPGTGSSSPMKQAGRDSAYLAMVRLLPCCAARLSSCEGTAVDAHHAGPRPGVAMKAHDRTAVPLCRHHHQRFHDAAHPFRRWSKAMRREWQDEQIRVTQEALDAPPFDAEQDRRDEGYEAWPVGAVQHE